MKWIMSSGISDFPGFVRNLADREMRTFGLASVTAVVEPPIASDEDAAIALSNCAVLGDINESEEFLIASGHARAWLAARAIKDYLRADFHRDFIKGMGLNPSLRPATYEPETINLAREAA